MFDTITKFWICFGVGICVIGYGMYMIGYADEIYQSEPDKHEISYYQQQVQANYSMRGVDLEANSGYTNIDHLTVNFTTIDVFSVNHPYYVDVGLILKQPTKITNVLFTFPSTSSNFNKINNATELFGYLNARGEQHLIYSLNQTDDGNFVGKIHLLPLIPQDEKILLFLFTNITENGNKFSLGVEKVDISQTLITIEPRIAILEAQTDENSQIQILNTNRTNDVIEGLTWIIVGAIPLEYAIQSNRSKQEKAEEHRRKLHDDFSQYYNSRIQVTFRLLPLLQNFPDTRLYLQHIRTAHDEFDTAIRNLIAIELQMPPVGTAVPRPLSIQHTDAFAVFRQQLEEMENHMRQHVEDIGGICENCIKFHDMKGIKFRKMNSRLKTFTMPF